MKPASGIPYWPSRDPKGEKGGKNLYGFVGNDGVDRRDFLGLSQLWPWSGRDFNPIQAIYHAGFDLGVAVSGSSQPEEETCKCPKDLGKVKDFKYLLISEVGAGYDKHEFTNVKKPIEDFLKDIAKEEGKDRLDKLVKGLEGSVQEFSDFTKSMTKGYKAVAQAENAVASLFLTGVQLQVSFNYCTKEKGYYVWEYGIADADPWDGEIELYTEAGVTEALEVYKDAATQSGERMAKVIHEAKSQ